MRIHLLVGAAMLAAASASSSAWGGESKDAAVPGAGVPAPTSQRPALRTRPGSAHASAAAKPRNGTPYRGTNETFAGISRGTKTAGIAGDDWSAGGGSKPNKGSPGKKDPSK